MKPILMPKLGLTMEEGTLIRWLKSEGDAIEKGETLFEVETDKSINEVASLASGKLAKVLLHEGETTQILQVIGFILEPGDETPTEWTGLEVPAAAPEERKAAAAASSEPAFARKPRRASPRAIKLAEEKGINLDGINGTGPNGRITEEDVLQLVNAHPASHGNRLKQITAERMAKSFSTIPHFYLKVEVDASQLIEWRKKILTGFEKATGLRMSISDLLILLAAHALSAHPEVNSTWEDGEARPYPAIDINLAVATPAGLTVPVIKNAAGKTLKDIVSERTGLVEKARLGRLSLAELEGGTFTITNLGMYSVDEFAAIINPPQSSILAVGRITDRVVVEEGRMLVKPTVFLTLSIDHRVLDGAAGAEFLTDLKKAIEDPGEVILASGAGEYLIL